MSPALDTTQDVLAFFLKKDIKIPHLIVKVWTLVVVAPGHIFVFLFLFLSSGMARGEMRLKFSCVVSSIL